MTGLETKSSASSGAALVIGASGGIGSALRDEIARRGEFAQVHGMSRDGIPAIDLLSEASIAGAATTIARAGVPLRLLVDATGFLSNDSFTPERRLQDLDPAHLMHAFATNAVGPAMLMKHFLPLLPRTGRAVFATLSAKVGSIGDNRLGGWYSYRASKAALNQLVRTAAIELRRQRPDALCVALHPGTVDTRLSRPFAKSGLQVRSPTEAAASLLDALALLRPEHSGGFYDYRGEALPW